MLVFQAAAPIAGFNNADSEQIYRYDIKTNELGCISCPPAGVHPSGDAYLSAIDQIRHPFGPEYPMRLGHQRRAWCVERWREDILRFARSAGGQGHERRLDTYEWENGNVFLISSGTSAEYSLFLDNSESGWRCVLRHE